jgi:hypothetical protein
MVIQPRKLSFEEAWDSTTIFFVDEYLETEIDEEVEKLLLVANDVRISEHAQIDVTEVAEFIREQDKSNESTRYANCL